MSRIINYKKIMRVLFGKPSKAFTLVETMVAISILSLAITGPMLIAQKGIASAIYARDQITAFYLAQDAVEFVRNVRDSNRPASSAWLHQFIDSGCTAVGQKCQVDSRMLDFNTIGSGAIKTCASGTCPAMAYDSSNNLYGYDNGTGGLWSNSLFTRDITIAPVDTADLTTANEAEISVTITWRTNLFSNLRTFTVKEHIFNF